MCTNQHQDQSLIISRQPTEGTFRVTLAGRFSTGDLPHDVSPEVVTAAIETLFEQAKQAAQQAETER
jgi:hypothetical protein